MSASISPVRNGGRTAYLLPNFDEYIVAYADRRAICDPAYAKAVDSRSNVLFNHTIVLDGKIAGTWKRSLAKAGVTIEAKPFTSVNTAQTRKIAAAGERYGAFLGLEAHLSSSLR
jgi:hypothetical protein